MEYCRGVHSATADQNPKVCWGQSILILRTTTRQSAAENECYALSLPSLEMFPAKNFCRESFNGCTLRPCVGGQSCFTARLFEECCAIPLVFGRHLRQEESAASGHADEETVASYCDGVGRDRLRRRQDAEFDLQAGDFVDRDRIEARVFESRGAGGVDDGAIDGTDGKNIADTSAEISTKIERGESSAWFCQVRGWRIDRNMSVFQRGKDRFVGCLEQQSSFFRRELVLLYVERTRSKRRHHGRPVAA